MIKLVRHGARHHSCAAARVGTNRTGRTLVLGCLCGVSHGHSRHSRTAFSKFELYSVAPKGLDCFGAARLAMTNCGVIASRRRSNPESEGEAIQSPGATDRFRNGSIPWNRATRPIGTSAGGIEALHFLTGAFPQVLEGYVNLRGFGRPSNRFGIRCAQCRSISST
jgi:hypothetical protein